MKISFKLIAAMCLTVAITFCSLAAVQSAFGEEAQKPAAANEEKAAHGLGNGLLAIGVGLALLGGAIGTGLAQGSIGSAVVASCSENRSFLGIGIFLLALPETILIIATGIAYLLYQQIR